MVAARHSVHIADIRLWVTLGMKWDPGALDPWKSRILFAGSVRQQLEIRPL